MENKIANASEYISYTQVNTWILIGIVLVFVLITLLAIFYLLINRQQLKIWNSFLLGCNSNSNRISHANAIEVIPEAKVLPEKKKNDYKLTPTELFILQEFVHGMTTQAIADAHNKSADTINTHKKNIFKKMNVHAIQEAIYKAISEGIVEFNEVLSE